MKGRPLASPPPKGSQPSPSFQMRVEAVDTSYRWGRPLPLCVLLLGFPSGQLLLDMGALDLMALWFGLDSSGIPATPSERMGFLTHNNGGEEERATCTKQTVI